jgi:hypothetical protein
LSDLVLENIVDVEAHILELERNARILRRLRQGTLVKEYLMLGLDSKSITVGAFSFYPERHERIRKAILPSVPSSGLFPEAFAAGRRRPLYTSGFVSYPACYL